MPSNLPSLISLFTGTAILLVGHGLQLTLLPVRADAMGWTTHAIGLTGSAYFSGFVVGCFSIPGVIGRVGHVRTFMVLTAVATSALLGIAVLDHLAAWLALRFATGLAISGLYLVIESWLNEQSTDQQRGTVLATYTTVVLLAMIVGQFLMSLTAPTSTEAVVVGTLFLCLAAIPVGMSLSPAPGPVRSVSFALGKVFAASHAAVGGAFLAGLVTGAFYALAPVLGIEMGLGVTGVAAMMSAGMLGGAVMQLPLGRLSDRIDRRQVLLTTMAVGAGVCLAATAVGDRPALLLLFVFLLGGTAMPIYAICLAHANDKGIGSFLEIGTSILIVNALGSVLGPVLASAAMEVLGVQAFFWYAAAMLGLGAVYVLASIRRGPAPRPHFEPFKSTPKTTQGAVELDPRSASRAPDGP